MVKKKKSKMELRYYDIPSGMPVLALQGKKWTQSYGKDAKGEPIEYLHFHNHMEIGYCYSGVGTMTLEDEKCGFTSEMFSIIPKNYPHTTDSEGYTESTWAYLFIDVENMLDLFYPDNEYMAEEMSRRINKKAHLIKREDSPIADGLIGEIFILMQEKREFYLDEVKAILNALFLEIARMNKEHTKDNEGIQEEKNLVARALDYVNQNYADQIRVEDLAIVCHISETHFRRVFHQFMNMTPVEYINQKRIQKACEYISKTNDPIAEIAQRTGFVTISTFNRNFKKIMKVSPREWRRNSDHYEREISKYKILAEKGW